MKNMHSGLPLVLSGLLFALIAPAISSAQTNVAAAPTGTYAPMSQITPGVFPFEPANTVPVVSLRLETNGTYLAEAALPQLAQDGDLMRLRPDIAQGTWHWDAEKREFLLEPGFFTFYIKRLPLSKRDPTCLAWGASLLKRFDSK
jgi:hypothetical protein